jgi:NAD-dependent SIR2 family protein deacetylase
VEAHGSFFSAHCVDRSCFAEYSQEEVRETIFKDEIPKCAKCDAFVKPDIVFFGENLPPRFYELLNEDFDKCDLLIVMGTSLTVHPFASLITKPRKEVKRVLINGEMCGTEMRGGFNFSSARDTFLQGACDDTISTLVALLGWEEEFKRLQELSE